MGVGRVARKFFGTDPVPVLDGFTRSSRGVRLPVCRRCGSVVAYETQRVHREWHDTAGP